MHETTPRAEIVSGTTVTSLLDSFPELAEPLASLSATFAGIRKSAVFQAMASVTTLGQLAERDGTDTAALVAKLRAVAGIPDAGDDKPTGVPAWFDASRIAASLDARAQIAAGAHPAQKVIAALRELPESGIFELITPFVPVPLIDMARMNGFDGWARRDGDQLVRTFFAKV